MAGCCSGGNCSSVEPMPTPEIAEEEVLVEDDCSQSSCCDVKLSQVLENPGAETIYHNPILQEIGDTQVIRLAPAQDIPNPLSTVDSSGDIILLSPSSKIGVCASSCCGGKPLSHQDITIESCESEQQEPHNEEPQNAIDSQDATPADIDISFSPRFGGCSNIGGACCVRKLSGQSDGDPSPSLPDYKPETASYTVIEVDGTERIVLYVQGMTCVGCEKNLIKALNAVEGISNITTSLLLCRAEFDFQPTEKISGADIATKAVERITGFTCKRVVDFGEELELILQAREEIPALSLPPGVSVEYCKRDRAIVTFNPNTIGARDLFSDPVFRNAQLAPIRPSGSVGSGRAQLKWSIYMTLLSATLTIPVLVLAYAQLPKHESLYGAVSLSLATIVQVVVAGPFYVRAGRTLVFSRMIEMDMLVVLSTSAAYIYSVIAYAFLIRGHPLSTSSFFETGTLLVTIIMIGQTLGKFARQQAIESISIESLQTRTAVIVHLKSQTEQKIDARLLQYGDTFKVLPDETVVTDGIVIDGETEVDESMITGEANLIQKVTGSCVIAGSINHSGIILVRLTRLPSENTIKIISALVDEAKASKPKVQEIADAFAGYFTPIIVLMTIIVFVIWVAIGIAVRHEKSSTACINAMTFAISTLIVSCPCAIGLALPMVLVIACGIGARRGLILKRSATIEIARKISHVVLDKTGTLTQGHPSVTEEQYFTSFETISAVILGLTANSKHPLSIAITKHLEGKGVEAVHLEKVTSVPGSGIEGTWNGALVRAGNQFWLGLENSPEVLKISSEGSTILCVTVNQKLVAVFGLEDQLRPEAQAVIGELKKRGISVSMISGDHAAAVDLVATQLSIPSSNVLSRCSPSTKSNYVTSLTSVPKSTVLFVGDGTNDAVALAQASIGMHMSSGTDVAQSAADTILMHSSLHGILTLIDLSRAFHRRVVFNFTWSLLYNVFAVLLAAGAFEGRGVRIEPRYAGLGELVSVLPVIAVAVSLRWAKF